MKICSSCKIEKDKLEFGRDISKVDGYSNRCKSCRSLSHIINKERNNKNSKKYYQSNRDDIIKRITDNKKSKYGRRKYLKSISNELSDVEKLCIKCEEVKNKNRFSKDSSKKDGLRSQCKKCVNIYQKERKKVDPLFKLSTSIRSLISKSIKRMGCDKKSKTCKILGCTFIEFKNFIESNFEKGMEWDNYGEWHLDHKKPISHANSIEEILKLNHFSNFQPLWSTENLKKGNRYSTL